MDYFPVGSWIRVIREGTTLPRGTVIKIECDLVMAKLALVCPLGDCGMQILMITN